MQSYTGEGEQNSGCTGKNRLLLGVVELENSPKNLSNKILCHGDSHPCGACLYYVSSYSSCIKWCCELIENAPNWPHYVIKPMVSVCYLSILWGMHLLYWDCTLCRIMQGTINKFVSSAVRLPTREPSRLLCLGSTTAKRQAEETGCNFWLCGSQKKSPRPKAAGGSRAIVFTLTTRSVEVWCCWRPCFLTQLLH